MTKKEYIQKAMQVDKLYDEVIDLFIECSMMDEGVERYFDMESEKILNKKKRILTRIKDGEYGPGIGKEYFDILENIPRDSNGKVNIVVDW